MKASPGPRRVVRQWRRGPAPPSTSRRRARGQSRTARTSARCARRTRRFRRISRRPLGGTSAAIMLSTAAVPEPVIRTAVHSAGSSPYTASRRCADLVLQVEELALAMTQIGLQQAAADTLRQRDRPGIEQKHQRAPAEEPKCCIRRVLTSTGVTEDAADPSGVPGRVSRRANRGPSSGGSSSHEPIRAHSSSVSREEA